MMNKSSNPRDRKIKYAILFIYFFFLIITCINPPFMVETYAQNIPTILFGIFLIYVARKNSLSNTSFSLLSVFWILHMIGARWSYTWVPYEGFTKSLFGFSINDVFGFVRNQYDRLVHFMYGFLLMIPMAEIYTRWLKYPQKTKNHVAFLFILATSAMYEMFQWILYFFVSPELAQSYSATQNDIWDSQKDMFVALIGASMMWLGIYFNKENKKK